VNHSPREVRRSDRAVWMQCSEECGNAWVVFLTPAGERKAGYGFTRQCPSVQQDRRTARQHSLSA
jgi:hypothetical protein